MHSRRLRECLEGDPLDTMASDRIVIPFIEGDFEVSEFSRSSWERCKSVFVSTYWNGEEAPASRQFATKTLWSERCLYVRFKTAQAEEIIVSATPQIERKTIGLWERDVCEIFIAPVGREPRKYFEFEVAPTGEWLDLVIDMTGGERITDWEYHSGMGAAARIDNGRILMAMRIPWEAFGRKPRIGDVWLGNIFRCVGREPDRGYLAWRPTMTEAPNFHVPERFGQLIFDN